MNQQNVQEMCRRHMHRYVMAQTADGQEMDGIIAEMDDENVVLAVPDCTENVNMPVAGVSNANMPVAGVSNANMPVAGVSNANMPMAQGQAVTPFAYEPQTATAAMGAAGSHTRTDEADTTDSRQPGYGLGLGAGAYGYPYYGYPYGYPYYGYPYGYPYYGYPPYGYPYRRRFRRYPIPYRFLRGLSLLPYF